MSTARTRDTKLLATMCSELDAPYCDAKSKESILQLKSIGVGEVGYIKPLTYKQVRKLFPCMRRIPKRSNYFALHSANGDLIALTCSHAIAKECAYEEGLHVTYLN